jgi:hypothetical protein
MLIEIRPWAAMQRYRTDKLKSISAVNERNCHAKSPHFLDSDGLLLADAACGVRGQSGL